MATPERPKTFEDQLKDYETIYRQNRDRKIAARLQGSRRQVSSTPYGLGCLEGTSHQSPLDEYNKKIVEREQSNHGIKPKSRRTR